MENSKNIHIRCNFMRSPAPGIVFTQESLTDPSGKDDADINNIIARYRTTGTLVDPLEVDQDRRPEYGDVSTRAARDYQYALNKVIAARDTFEALSAKVRRRFNDDPKEFLAFISDPKNADEAVALGLMKPKKAEPQPAPSVADTNDSTSATDSRASST